MAQNYNSNYRIACYHLPEGYFNLLNQAMNQSDLYSEQTFNLKKVDDLSYDHSNHLMIQPDVLLIDETAEITPEMSAYSKQNLVQIIRVSDKLVIEGDPENMIVSLSPEVIATKKLTDGTVNMITALQHSVDFLADMAQMTNTEKLKRVSKKVLNEELEQVMPTENDQEIIDTLLRLNHFIRLKDGYTQMHSDHVSEYAVLLAKKLNLSEEEIHLIKIGGELHDIGKIGIPDAILMKQGKLTDQEFAIMKRHTVIGDTILPNTKGFQEIKKMIRHHHERIDGYGYPDGLKGEEIPYFARILAVADTFDAMTTQRTYNNVKTLEDAFKELRKSSALMPNRDGKLGQQLDSKLVDTFIEAVKEDSKLMEHFKKQDQAILEMREEKKIQTLRESQDMERRMIS